MSTLDLIINGEKDLIKRDAEVHEAEQHRLIRASKAKEEAYKVQEQATQAENRRLKRERWLATGFSMAKLIIFLALVVSFTTLAVQERRVATANFSQQWIKGDDAQFSGRQQVLTYLTGRFQSQINSSDLYWQQNQLL